MNPLQWLVPWEFSFAVIIVAAVTAMLFIRGSLKCKLFFRQKLYFLMLAVVPPQILIGALIFFTPHELYPVYTLCGRAFTGVSSISDQQIGGLILWMNAAMMSVIGILIVIHKELRQPRLILGVCPRTQL